MKESTIQLKILAGVPIFKNNDSIQESKIINEKDNNRIITKTLKTLITSLDIDIDNSTNREDKTELNLGASDLEDILAIVKSGKQKKAIKLYAELDSKIKSYITSKIDPNKAESFKKYFTPIKVESFKKYFTPITEMSNMYSDEGQEEMIDMDDNSMDYSNNPGEQSDNPDDIIDDNVKCPFCDCGTDISKIDFYDHIMDNHVEDSYDDKSEDEFDLNLGTLNNGSTLGMATQMNMEGVVDATVWDNVTDDKNESPSSYPVDTDKISLPAKIKSSLEKEIKELQKSSESLIVTDYNTAEFQNNVANAMIDVLNHLSKETESGMKMAQICITKYMSPIVQKFPSEVYDFILHGGYDTKKNTKNSLVSMFKEIKTSK